MLTPDYILQLLVDGIVTGSVYVLIAAGLTLIFGILGIVNFAQGEFYMLGGYFGITAAVLLRLQMLETLVVGTLAVAVVGLLCERVIFRPLQGQDMTNSIIASFGLAVALQNAALLVFGPEPKILRTSWATVPIHVGGLFLTLQRAIIPVVAAALILIIHLVLRYTWTGRSLRAMSQHPTMAQLCGVDVGRTGLVTFVLGAALAGTAGVLMSSVFLVQPGIGSMIVLKAFTVVILGGMGNIYGAVAAGLLLGVVEAFTSGFLNNMMRDIVGFAIVILVLLLRPQGIFGRSVERA
ncbi:MAG: branched-chain amino acid ABC transporter permease [Alphaproteobacteria bacterium]